MNVKLETGKYYRANGDLYLIGNDVPCIANKYCVRITKTGIAHYEVLYHRQESNFKEAKRRVLIKRKYKDLLIQIFCWDRYGNVVRNTSLIEQYLQSK